MQLSILSTTMKFSHVQRQPHFYMSYMYMYLDRLISSFVARFRSIGADPLAGLLREMFRPATWPCDLNHPVRPSLSRTSVHLRGACRKQNGREPRQLAHLLGATLCLSRPYMLHVSTAFLPFALLFAHQDPFVARSGGRLLPPYRTQKTATHKWHPHAMF